MRELGVRIGNSGLGDKGWASQKGRRERDPVPLLPLLLDALGRHCSFALLGDQGK